MERRKRVRGRNNGGIEENTMAILDTSGFNRDSHHRHDDSLAFLEAIRSASLLPDHGTPPTITMREAIFQILKEETSLELIMGSYQLLNELDKRFPRVCLPKMEKPESCLPPTILNEPGLVEEAWCPFSLGLDRDEEANKGSSGSIDPLGFHSLIQELGKMINQKSKALETKILRKMLLLHYLVGVLEADFVPRNNAFKEKMSWTLLRDSLLNMLLGSRKLIYKGLVKDCLSVICDVRSDLSDQSESTSDVDSLAPHSNEMSYNCTAAFVLALPELKQSTCIYLKKLLRMMMELDISRNVADVQGLTNRADGVRTPAAEIILDELAYNSDMLSPFFQVFDDPWWKLKMIMQYFQKYTPKSSVRTRRLNSQVNDSTFEGILKCFSNSSSTKSIIKKVGTDVAQLLLGHAFLAYLSVSVESSAEHVHDFEEIVKGSCLTEICKLIIAAFTAIRKEDKNTEILPFGKEAVFTAATILSTKS
ncbi:negative regulator of systemic acquired resistance SNI1 [Lycium ferocissimum]|uniref:negative regulator of systemic acquired resistance SNI1 n=1 Tax=Lycium ferocissimum TaxID=112874 RepID=UPI002814AAD0|nr:negative regulator of systemic acquired resistance SNI1 [Lycium ferocissimum]XP_059291126.1 negative regulator of systemic acquired resistance SNI1 [Lycium ferocissimum]